MAVSPGKANRAITSYLSAVDAYRNHAEIVVFPGGDHAFRHLQDSISHIRRFLET